MMKSYSNLKQHSKNNLVVLPYTMLAIALHLGLQLLNANNPQLHVLPHLLLLGFLFFEESKTRKTLFSPYSIFCYFYFLIVIFPLGMNTSVNSQLLSQSAMQKGSFIYLLFFSGTTLVYFSNTTKYSTKDIYSKNLYAYISFFYYILLAVGVFGLFLRLYSYFSLESFSIINLVLNPLKEYSTVRQEGRNWAIIFNEAFALFSIVSILCLNKEVPRKLKPSKVMILFGFLIFFTNALLSGNKTAFFWPIIGIFSVQGFFYNKIKIWALIVLLFLTFFTLIFSFQWRGFTSNKNPIIAFAEYNHSFYYSVRTIDEVKPSINYLSTALRDLVLYMVPRATWADKPIEMGLTRRYLDYKFRGTQLSLTRASSVMGLSETWMAGGYAGIFFSAIIMGQLLSWARRNLEESKNIRKVIYSCYIIGTIYFIFRVGFFSFYIYNLLFSFILLLMIDFISSLKQKKSFQ